MPSIKFLTAVMCEDVRREFDGRAILVGASMVGPSVAEEGGSVVGKLSFYLEAEVFKVNWVKFRLIKKKTDYIAFDDVEMKLDFDIEDIPAGELTEGGADVVETIGAVLAFTKDDVKFDEPGRYHFEYKTELSDEWQPIREFHFPKRD